MGQKRNTGTGDSIDARLQAIRDGVERELPPHPPVERTPAGQHRHLLEEAQELYANELLWEEESGEEVTDSGSVVELVFPGTLALVDALVTSHTPTNRGEGSPHRDVVFSFLEWLADRLLRLRSAQGGANATDRAKKIDLTDRLIDLVLYRYYSLTEDEIEQMEATRG